VITVLVKSLRVMG